MYCALCLWLKGFEHTVYVEVLVKYVTHLLHTCFEKDKLLSELNCIMYIKNKVYDEN